MVDRTANPFWMNGGSAAAIAAADDRTVTRLIPYVPEGATGPTTAVIVCPGGGYQRLAAHENEPIARWLNTLGIAAFVLEYRVAPHPWPAPLEDAQRAMRLVRFHAEPWNVRPDRVGILGFSAGGHLAATIGTHYDQGNREADDPVEQQSCRPDFLVMCYAMIDPVLTRAGRPPAEQPPSHSSDVMPAADAHVTPETPPSFLFHTADDPRVPVANSLYFAEALSRHGVPFALHVYPHGRHGVGLAQDDPIVGTWTSLCADWLAGR